MLTTAPRIALRFDAEILEGGYIRYVSTKLPGFRVLCEPGEDPRPLIQQAAHAFIPLALKAWAEDRAG